MSLSLKDLRPAGGHSADIRAAFFRLRDARTANDEAMAGLDAARPGLLMTASATEIDRHDESLRKRRIFAEQLDTLEAELRRQFEATKNAEDDADFVERLAEIKATEAAWNSEMLEKYSELAASLVALLEREANIRRNYTALARMPSFGRQQSRCDCVPALLRPQAPPHQHALTATFGGLVALPSMTARLPLWPSPK